MDDRAAFTAAVRQVVEQLRGDKTNNWIAHQAGVGEHAVGDLLNGTTKLVTRPVARAVLRAVGVDDESFDALRESVRRGLPVIVTPGGRIVLDPLPFEPELAGRSSVELERERQHWAARMIEMREQLAAAQDHWLRVSVALRVREVLDSMGQNGANDCHYGAEPGSRTGQKSWSDRV